MSDSTFVYVIYIRTTPEKLWSALTTDAEFMKQYWFGTHWQSDWKAGAKWKMVGDSGKVLDAGDVLESDPPRRLVLSWRHQDRPELTAEGDSRCTIEIEPSDGAVKLSVTHTIAVERSKLITAVGGGWPKILSNLKSLIETGKVALGEAYPAAPAR